MREVSIFELASCVGKTPYVSHDAAMLAAAATRDRHGVKKAYKCQFCEAYHIGHSSKASREARNKREHKKRMRHP